MEAVHRYEGTVNQVMGDGIMALFGAPLAHEDHAVRACYAALRMQESAKKYAEQVRRSHAAVVKIRVGLNSGEVVVRAIGSDLHMDYTAVGQTTHLAARMKQLASPGTMRLTADTLRLGAGTRRWRLSAAAARLRGLARAAAVRARNSPLASSLSNGLAWLRARYQDFETFNAIWRTPAQSWQTLDALERMEPPHTHLPVYQRDAGQEHAANHADAVRAEFFAGCDAFAALVGQRYFETTCAAIKAADPNHLVLGGRFAYVPPPGVIEAAATHCDVISINCYDLDPGRTVDAYKGTQKPCLIGEFSFRGSDSGLPNTNGAGPLMRTQAERAAAYRRYAAAALSQPAIVGLHWFEHADQPAEGRFDGENSNFGVVTINDEVYDELTQTMKSLNVEAEAIHMSAGRTG